MFHFFTKVESISTAELEKRLKTNIKLLDVRTPSEYNRGHIKGALNIPLGQIDRYSQSKEEKLYVICHSGDVYKRQSITGVTILTQNC